MLVSVWKRFWIFCQILNSTNSCTVLFLKCFCHNGRFSFCRFFPAFLVYSWCEFVEKMVEIFVKENRDYLNDHYVPLSSSVVLTTNSYLIEFLYMILIWLVFVWYIVLIFLKGFELALGSYFAPEKWNDRQVVLSNLPTHWNKKFLWWG